MSNTQQVLAKLNELEGTICQSISTAVSEAAGQTITFSNPLSSLTPVTELESEMNQPWLVIQFAFQSSPENAQVLLISQDHFISIAQAISGIPVATVDDTIITECRPALEAIVSGLSSAVGQQVTESTINFQLFSPTSNFNEAQLFRTNIAISGEELSATIVLLMDCLTASTITGIEIEAEVEHPFMEADSFSSPSIRSESDSLEILLDIPLEISVELGRMKMPVRDVIDLGAGSIVEIDKAAGEPVDVLVNGRLVAKGEVVVIEDSFGVRITEILSPNERMQRLSEAA
ncbi:MAG: flagellar motor switch protein FliN [Fimbriimonadaceae bacterium]|nr:flagellar motor switch protein FliN [Fimbriimonadaceae bacterium]